MTEFMVELMQALNTTFPRLVVQFEDFSTDNAFKYLDMFRHPYKVFNDDIQGTGGVVLSGFINAARIASKDPNSKCPKLGDHKVLFFGAGSAGIGVAKQLMLFFKLQGLSEEEARERIYTVDSKGIVVHGKAGLAEHKKCKRFFIFE
jgi:malate dehydrogenase (oxaloacetate-decarboxylating)(NADP+)